MTHPSPRSRCARVDFLPQGESFGEAAARLCNAAAVMLGWRPYEFWEATPAELALALESPVQFDGPDPASIDELMQRFPD